MPPDPPDPPGQDAVLSAVHSHVDDLGGWLAVWAARSEPDAHARRCASDAMDAIDTALAGLHWIRAELVTQIRQADDQAAIRADELLARMRDGPPGHATPKARHNHDPATTAATGLRGQPAHEGSRPCPR
jgi:hypothetical protein